MDNTKRNPQIFPLGRSASIVSDPVVPIEPDIVDDDISTDVTELKKCGQYFPVKETNKNYEMYAYYEGLGRSRTLNKVAQHFGKSYSTMTMLSRQYGWKDRVRAADGLGDPVREQSREPVDDARLKLVKVVNEVADTLYEIMHIAKACKAGRMTTASEEKLERLQRSLKLWGFDWKSPSAFKALVETMKQVMDFNAEVKNRVPAKATQTNIETFELHIQD
jgi:hypothetical protein